MCRWTRGRTVRGVSITLSCAGAMLGGVSCRGDDPAGPTEPAAPTGEPAPALDITPAQALGFLQVSAGDWHTCGVTTDNRAYCWSYNPYGQVGDGTTATRLTPVAVAGTLHFRQVSVGGFHTCGVTPENRAYCWGANFSGQLGDGTTTNRLTPVPVAGGRQFRRVEAGEYFTCGVSYPENLAYCWGSNDEGQLGDGTETDRRVPVAVAGARPFRQVNAGYRHTCGVTTSDAAFCWGSNLYGQIGDSSTARLRRRPSRVAGAHQFRQVETGYRHSCAVTTANQAFCWGDGRAGQIGNGKSYLSFWPRAVAGGLSFRRVSAGGFHSCGVTTADQAYCWGSNGRGQRGDGTTVSNVLTPVAVAGGLSFSQLSAGQVHTCGTTTTAAAYCWGYNFFGELGDGTTNDQSTPVAVVAPI